MLQEVGLSEVRQEGRRRRRERFVAAIDATGVTQADLARRMNREGLKTAPTTVNRWYVGAANIDEDMLTFVMQLLGLPASWQAGDPVPDDAAPAT